MITQIYSIQTVEEAVMCAEAGADRIGVAVATGANLPAEVSVEQCREIFNAVRGKCETVLIVVTDDGEAVFPPMKELSPDVIHICGNNFFATPEFCKKAKELCPGIKVLQAVAIDGKEAVERAMYYAGFCDEIILDSVDPGIAGIGAAGVTNDWDIDAEIVERAPCRVILAGGLGPDNVRDAIMKVRPWGVDSFTRTSDKFKDGTSKKNPEKVRAFINEARAAAKDLEI
ncbi:MAG: phosphoribosylanthranilate isomerase [Oscillospiraceae bacterium]|nr:phosphoribosylanthranilate isomerase [Oscillospiraceae bacterium]